MDNKRGSAIFYESFYDSTKDLDDQTFRESWTALLEYAFYGKNPEGISPISAMFFKMAKPVIDKATQAKEWGSTGGRPKKGGFKTQKGGFEDKKGGFLNEKAPIYDVDVDVDKDVDKDVDVDVDVDVESAAPEGEQTTTHTDTPSETTGRPSNLDVLGEIVSKGYRLEGASIKAFMDYNDDRGWKMDWRLALKRWADREQTEQPKQNKAGKFANFPQRNDPQHKALVDQLIAQQIGGD